LAQELKFVWTVFFVTMFKLACSAGFFTLATAGVDVPLVTFDGAESTTRKWQEMNDPVMGGKSTGDFKLGDNVGIFHGVVADVPFLHAPGFILTRTVDQGAWPDVSACAGLQLTVQSITDYKGYRFSFGTAHAAGGKHHAFGYKQDFDPPMGEFGDVQLSFDGFSDYWDDATGKQMKTCKEDKQYCPTKKDLEDLQTMSVWGEGVNGEVHLEIKSISAYGCPSDVIV